MKRLLAIAVAFTACTPARPPAPASAPPAYASDPRCDSADPGDDRTPDELGCVEVLPDVWVMSRSPRLVRYPDGTLVFGKCGVAYTPAEDVAGVEHFCADWEMQRLICSRPNDAPIADDDPALVLFGYVQSLEDRKVALAVERINGCDP